MEALHFVLDQMLLLFSSVPPESAVSWFSELNQRRTLALSAAGLMFGRFSSLNRLNGSVHGEQLEHMAEERGRKWAAWS